MFCLNSTLNFGKPPVLVFQLKLYYKVDRLLIGLNAQQMRTTARWYSNKTSLVIVTFFFFRSASSVKEKGELLKNCTNSISENCADITIDSREDHLSVSISRLS